MHTNSPKGARSGESSYFIRLLMFFSITLAPISLLTPACSLGKAEQAASGAGARADGVPVLTGTVTKKNVPLELRVIGAVEAFSVVAVKSQVGGELTRTHFSEGQFVNKGDTLFTIDPRPFETSLSQAEANLAKSMALEKQAEANLARDLTQSKNATAQAERYASLLESGVVSHEQYDQIKTTAEALAETVRADKANIETAQKAIDADKATVQSARLQLSFTTVRAPIDGRTGSLMVYQGNLVRTSDSTPLVMINQMNPIHVTFSAPEKQLAEIKSYMSQGKLKAQVFPPDDKAHPELGTVDFIDNAVDNTTGTIKLKAVFPNKERKLWPGQFVNVNLTLTTEADAVVAPSQAVQTGQQGQFVFVVKHDQTVEMRPVVVARTFADDSVIESGVNPGEVLVIDGQLRLTPGARVRIKTGENGQKPTAMSPAVEGGGQ